MSYSFVSHLHVKYIILLLAIGVSFVSGYTYNFCYKNNNNNDYVSHVINDIELQLNYYLVAKIRM